MFWRHHRQRQHAQWQAPGRPPSNEWEHGQSERLGRQPKFGRGHTHARPPWLRGLFAARPPFRFGPRGGRPFGSPSGRRGPGGGDPFDQGGGGRRRRRGDMRYVLLELLAERPRHGYELIKELEQRDADFFRPSPGSVYPTLQLLEEENSLTSESVDGKRVYTITDAGRRVLNERQQRAGEAAGRGHRADPELDREPLRHATTALLGSVMEVARHGTAEQQRAVLERLNALRREIYGILAQNDPDMI